MGCENSTIAAADVFDEAIKHHIDGIVGGLSRSFLEVYLGHEIII